VNKGMIFKFRAINKRMIESLVNAEVYFSLPGNLNDPFDCQIDIEKSLGNAIRRVDGVGKKNLELLKENFGSFFSKVQTDLKTYGVWSCSLELENPLMWAHYGDEHRGICLLYELPEKFKDHKLGEIIGSSPIDYEKNPIVELFIEKSESLNNQEFGAFSTDLIVKLLTSKDECWSYEKEARVISRASGTKKIGKTALKQVCFGLRTPQSDKDLVKEILSRHDYDVTICEIERDHNDFGLQAKEI
jgi:hypothetical protein